MTASLHDLLTQLGDTPDAVADRLRALGIKGRRNHPGCCPLARYLEGDGRFGKPSVGTLSQPSGPAWVNVYATVGDTRRCATFGPDTPIGVFVHRFDQGDMYLDLAEVARGH